jgi:hypothetical protein
MAKNRRHQNKRKVDSSDDESHSRLVPGGSKKQKIGPENSIKAVTLRPPDWTNLKPFHKNNWTGMPGECEPSEELKQKRKSIGVVVKGNLAGCPPPVFSSADNQLPDVIQNYFANNHLKSPTPIQQQSWPAILQGSNVLGIAPTGSGKVSTHFGFYWYCCSTHVL